MEKAVSNPSGGEGEPIDDQGRGFLRTSHQVRRRIPLSDDRRLQRGDDSLDAVAVFVSYAHKDGDIVYPELLALHQAAYRVWYDEGIDPGNEWPEEIAKAEERASELSF